MSFNRSKYDTCAYKYDLQANVSTLDYVLSDIRYNNANKCRHQLGLFQIWISYLIFRNV